MAEALALDPAPGVRIVWDVGAVRSLAPAGADEPRSLWSLEGSPEGEFSALRVLSGALEDGTVVLLAALRPHGAAGHGEELAAALVAGPDGPQPVEEALLSSEYGSDGAPRRITLELWRPGEEYPLRAAGDATGVARHGPDEAGVSRVGAAMRFRFEGRAGAAMYEIATGL